MSKNMKIILVVAVSGIGIVACLCLILGGFIALNTLSSTSTPISQPTTILNAATPQPSISKPTAIAQPTELPSPEPDLPSTPTPLPADASFELDGVSLKVYSVQYSLINGGEDGVNIVTNPDEFLVLITLGSNTKELGFIYDNYFDSTRLIDLVNQNEIDPDWQNWSGEESFVNSGYVKISFPVDAAPEKAAIYFTDELGIDITSMLPASDKPVDPWIDVKKKFDVDRTDMKIQSAFITKDHTAQDGEKIQKEESSNKIMVIDLTSSQTDLTGLRDWDPILVDGDNQENQYYLSYTTWTTGDHQGQGGFELVYEVPPDLENVLLYIPYENLIDFTSIVKKK